MRKFFKYPIAYSDHSPNFDIDIMAVTLGVPLIEKTITENKYKKEIEHMFSLEKKKPLFLLIQLEILKKHLKHLDILRRIFLKADIV